MRHIVDFIKPRKANIILDGQFGSVGKGLLAAYVATHNHIDIACARLSPNAGHTFYYRGKKCVSKMIPVAGIMSKRNLIYLGHGCVIDPDILFKEMEEFDIDPDRICIHPRAAIVTPENKLNENISGIIKIASTQSGAGEARSTKILRTNPLAMGYEPLRPYVKGLELNELLKQDLNILIETGQGFDLSLNEGYSYPYCTSIDVTPSAILADFGLHPYTLGNIFMGIRTFPIRVGNPKDNDGNEIGYSGPVYPDSEELSWEELGVEQEYTTVTGRVRRVFTFSKEQYIRSLEYIRPTHIFLNFINYLREEDISLFDGLRKPTHVGYGPYTHQIEHWDGNILENYFHKKHKLAR